ncbi:SpaH/EbpB family LPXTG-anchored major pilin [Streptococcus parasuis]|uniref:SpaH/EbpB family LPXTG-anchored major pilin n=1 Tax=Streptococcus parasuis TaxID=1501662 RepID=UPI0028AACD43|nr:SpaH/EbpB family LPXTG-anchored major pilin [Streptococcus parasuis]
MKLIKKLVTGLMILLVALGSSPLEVFALPNNGFTEWPTGGTNDVTSTLPQPPAAVDIVDLKQMFNYPILDYSGLHGKPDSRWKETWRPWELNVIKSLKGYVPVNDSSVAVITRDAPWQAGVMWSQESNKINLAEKFHMISYVYLGSRGQADKFVDGNKRAGADGITFTIHNDKKDETILDDNERNVLAGNKDNHGMNAYGALGNGLGVYGSNFSANTASPSNNTADMRQGVTNGIALEFDTFYNHNNTTQHSDNDLWKFVGKEGDPNSNFGHIGINYLNDLQYNRANEDTLTGTSKQFSKDTYSDTTMIKHRDMLSVGWNGNVTGFSPAEGWQAQVTGETQKLADGKWHRLEVTWEPNTTTKTTGKLTYKIYRQGYNGPPRQLTSITPIEEYDGNSTIDKVVEIDVKKVFDVDNIYNSVYWGFTGSTGYYQNNQAVQMLQLPVNYYTAELSKVDQDRKPVSGARFQIEKKNEKTGEWEVQKFYNLDPENPGDVDTLETGTQDQDDMEIYDGVFQSLGKIKLKKLTYGKYRWTEISAPDGYEKKKTYFPDEDGFFVNNENATVTTEAENKKLYQLELTKKNSETQGAIDGVPFIISKTENDKQYYLKLNANSKGFVWTEDKTVAKHFLTKKSYLLGQDGTVTEQDGVAGKIIVKYFPDAPKYFPDAPNLSWEEVSVPKGYDSSGTLTGYFEASKDGYVYSATQTNTPIYQVSLEKTARDTEAPLAGAVFSLEQYDGSKWKAVGDNKTTDKYGKITISNLKAGTYRWKEVKAPDGYQISKTYHPDLGGFKVQYESNLAIENNNHIFKPTSVENAPKDFVLTLEKLLSTFHKPLQGVEFKLYDSDDSAGEPDFSTLEPKYTVKTEDDGKIVLNEGQIQADKTYYLVESPVDGFIPLKGYFTIKTSKTDGFTDVTYTKDGTETDERPFNFTTKENDKYSGYLTIYNKRRESILPTTGGNGILGYVGIGLTMTIVALLFFIARKRIFKWLIILIVATSGLAGLAGGTQVVSAQEQEQVQLEVNRLVYQPSDRQYKSGVPVAGAKLEVVDVTKSFYELVNRQKLSLKEAQEAVSKSNKIDGQSLAVATTDQSGLVCFTVSKTSQQRPAVYLIRELLTPVAVTKMENMVVVLPILDESGNEKSLISLFPKSHGTFSFDKTIDEKQSSYSFGEPIPYRLSTIIPQDMTNLSSYEIEDIYDQGLRFNSESLEIFIDGEKQSDSIKAVSLSENQFRVVFDVAKLADFSGKKLKVTYQMVIKDEAAIDQDLVNTATLYPGDLTPLVDRENVQTGGFRFIKRAAEGKQNPLAKATFVIKNPTDDTVLTYKEGKYQFEKVATNASEVVRLTSDDDGYFEIRGLRYGEYLVSEIRAPSGYVLNDKPTAFTVGVSTYSQGPVLSIFNVKKPKIRLPETGTVATSTAFVGLLIMASSLVMIRRRKDN